MSSCELRNGMFGRSPRLLAGYTTESEALALWGSNKFGGVVRCVRCTTNVLYRVTTSHALWFEKELTIFSGLL